MLKRFNLQALYYQDEMEQVANIQDERQRKREEDSFNESNLKMLLQGKHSSLPLN